MATVIEKPESHSAEDADRPRRKMTLSEFNALPEDPDWDRMLIAGELWEKPMTKRNRWHAEVEASIAHLLKSWRAKLPKPRGQVFSGEVGCDFPELETGFGIDVAYFSHEVLSQQEDDSKYILGAPTLAVEILSPSEKKDEIDAKVVSYLSGGVQLIWIVDYQFKTVTVFRPDADPAMISGDREITGESHLPGFAVPVSEFFDR